MILLFKLKSQFYVNVHPIAITVPLVKGIHVSAVNQEIFMFENIHVLKIFM